MHSLVQSIYVRMILIPVPYLVSTIWKNARIFTATYLLHSQCCGYMTFWYGSRSGSADPCLWLMDPDSDPDPGPGSCYFRHRSSRCQQKTIFHFFSAYYFLKVHLHLFSKIKSQKESQTGFRIRIDLMRIRIQHFSNCGSGFRIRIPDPDPRFDDLKLKKTNN